MKLTIVTSKQCALVNVLVLVTVLRSDDHKRSIKNCNRKRNEIAKCCWEAEHNFSWDKERGVDRENRSIPSKIKELQSL